MLFFGWIAVTGTVFVQTGEWIIHSVLLGTQVGALSTALIAINNLRDAAEDATTGKRTLAVRFGVPWARRETMVLLLLPFPLGFLWWFTGHAGFALGPLVALPLAGAVARRVGREPPGPGHNLLLAKAGVCLMLFAIGFHLGAFL